MSLSSRHALPSDADLLGLLNHQLIQDEGHRNPMTVPELQERMRGWLAAEYAAVLFENETEVVAYALYREEPELIYLRQFSSKGIVAAKVLEKRLCNFFARKSGLRKSASPWRCSPPIMLPFHSSRRPAFANIV